MLTSTDGGKKTPYHNDAAVARAAAEASGVPLVRVPDFVLEGGSVELDGTGTAMLCRSSVVSKSRNPGVSQETAEKVLSKYFGVSNFIWLDGVAGEDITDGHIDGFARFLDDRTLLTVPKSDFFDLYETIRESDYTALTGARNIRGERYRIVELPLTAKKVKGVGFKGSYLNYYPANTVVFLPVYCDENDEQAERILQNLYPDRQIVPIDVRKLFREGGMLHCVTQQQPARSLR